MTRVEDRRSFPSTPASAGAARRFVDAALAEPEVSAVGYAATMLVSELVANAVLRTGTAIEVVDAVAGGLGHRAHRHRQGVPRGVRTPARRAPRPAMVRGGDRPVGG